MSGMEHESDRRPGGPAETSPLRSSPWLARAGVGPAPGTVGARPVLWRWWLAAGLLSIAMWAGIFALVL